MNKKVISVIVVLVVILAGGVLCYMAFFNDAPEIQQEIIVDEPKYDGEIIEIPVESVNGISKEEAEELCYAVLGEEDEETGYPFSFGVSGAVERSGKKYYTIRASWLVNNSHMSYIGDFFVSADGDEIYTGLALSGEYEMTSLVWSK